MLSGKVKIFQPYRENLKSLKTILKNYVSSILEISGRFWERLKRFISNFKRSIQVKSQQWNTGITYCICSRLKTLKTVTMFGFWLWAGLYVLGYLLSKKIIHLKNKKVLQWKSLKNQFLFGNRQFYKVMLCFEGWEKPFWNFSKRLGYVWSCNFQITSTVKSPSQRSAI